MAKAKQQQRQWQTTAAKLQQRRPNDAVPSPPTNPTPLPPPPSLTHTTSAFRARPHLERSVPIAACRGEERGEGRETPLSRVRKLLTTSKHVSSATRHCSNWGQRIGAPRTCHTVACCMLQVAHKSFALQQSRMSLLSQSIPPNHKIQKSLFSNFTNLMHCLSLLNHGS